MKAFLTLVMFPLLTNCAAKSSGPTSAETVVIPTPADGERVPKNKVINGAMRFDQRHNGEYPHESLRQREVYSLDQWRYMGAGLGAWKIEQVPSTLPGFEYALKSTVVLSQSAIAPTDNHHIEYPIEGRYLGDMEWGTPSAKTVTVSFWARFSKAGHKPFALMNGVNGRARITTYEILHADEWQKVEITMPGDTEGSWPVTDWTFGIKLLWAIGGGNTYSTTDEWMNRAGWNVTGSDSLIMEDPGSSFEMTGVQFEVSDHATEFEHLEKNDEKTRLERYYKINADGSVLNHSLGGN